MHSCYNSMTIIFQVLFLEPLFLATSRLQANWEISNARKHVLIGYFILYNLQNVTYSEDSQNVKSV